MSSENKFIDLPLVALRGVVMFPKGILSFEVGRQKSIEALETSLQNGSIILVASQTEAQLNEPHEEDIQQRGTLTRILQILKLPHNVLKIIAEGLSRADISEYTQTEPYFRVSGTEVIEIEPRRSNKTEALILATQEAFEAYAKASGRILPDAIKNILSCDRVSDLSDLIAIHSHFHYTFKQQLLSMDKPEKRLNKIIVQLYKDVELMTLQRKIATNVKASIEKSHREHFLREQLKVIGAELGAEDGLAGEVKAYRKRMETLSLPKPVSERLEKELQRLSKLHISSGETGTSRDYIEWLLDLPWMTNSAEHFDLAKCETVLNEDHYGLEKVKERVLEFLAVRQNAPKLDAPIICLVGPPGVGKTSIAKSIARSLNREYVRISLGGIRDEADIRGHRKTYVGSMPGRIINALKQAQTRNPLILLDEIDKMVMDFKGDPSSALLEVLDNEQNQLFRDHYIELPFDLSDVLFVCTANSADPIQKPLADRLEMIPLSSYTKEEKYHIANNFLVAKQLKKHGLKKINLRFKKEALEEMVQHYTREAGVRQLERLLGKICRKSVKKMMSENKKQITIHAENLTDFLGAKKYRNDDPYHEPQIGIVRGLAWTAVGGTTLSVEVNIMKGSGKLELTGTLGDVMKESARVAITYIRSQSDVFRVPKNFYKNLDIHIHIPEGATPKDGPSAGVTMTLAILSALTDCPVRHDVGMTGEITIRGNVLPIGGLKEKILAAKNAGLQTIILPMDNKGDLEELQDYVKEGLTFFCVSSFAEIPKIAFSANTYERKEKEKKDDHK